MQLEGEPLEGVTLTVAGNGFEAEVETDAEGQWAVGVPEKETTTRSPSTSRPCPRASRSSTPSGRHPEREGSDVRAGGRVIGQLLPRRGRAHVTSFFDQLVQRVDQRPQLRPAARARRDRALARLRHDRASPTSRTARWSPSAPSMTLLVLGASLGLPLWVGDPHRGRSLSALLGLVLDAGLWRPLRRRGLGIVQLMIVSIGLSLALRYMFQFFIGGGTTQLPGAIAAQIQLFGVGRAQRRSTWSAWAISIVVILGVRALAAAHPDRQGDPRDLRQPVARRGIRHRRRPRRAHRLDPRRRRSPASPASCGRTSARASSGTWARRSCC